MTYDEIMSWISDARTNHQTFRNRFLYCMTEGSGEPVKIGVTRNPRQRFHSMQVHTWRDLSFSWCVRGELVHEQALKKLLQHRLIKSEWFRDDDDLIKGAETYGALARGESAPDWKCEILKAIRVGAHYQTAQKCGWAWADFDAEYVTPHFDGRYEADTRALCAHVGVTLPENAFCHEGDRRAERIVARFCTPFSEAAE